MSDKRRQLSEGQQSSQKTDDFNQEPKNVVTIEKGQESSRPATPQNDPKPIIPNAERK